MYMNGKKIGPDGPKIP